jgi:hypothetical protein
MRWCASPRMTSARRARCRRTAACFFTIFQTFMSGPPKDGKPSPYFGEYPPDFFDFIVIDECHRGGANDESNWRGILDYFAPAVQLGLTATPKRKDNVDTYRYFGEPVYIYSLKEGINDGFLTPFKVKQIQTTMDSTSTRRTTSDRGRDRNRKTLRRDPISTRTSKSRSARRSASRCSWSRSTRTKRRWFSAPRQAHALARARPHQPTEDQPGPELLPAGHGQRRRAGRTAPAGLSGQREEHPDHPDHVAKTFYRRGCAQYPQHRPDAPHQFDDRVQADHRPRHAPVTTARITSRSTIS